MWKRLLIALCMLFVPAVILAGIAVWTLPRVDATSPITKENSQRIQVGMTEAEVNGILGPPGDHTSVAMEQVFWACCGPRSHYVQVWKGNQGSTVVNFVDNAVVGKMFIVQRPANLDPFQRALWDLLHP